MEITKDTIDRFYKEIEAENITPESGSPMLSALGLRLKLLHWLKSSNEEDYINDLKNARKFIDAIILNRE